MILSFQLVLASDFLLHAVFFEEKIENDLSYMNDKKEDQKLAWPLFIFKDCRDFHWKSWN